MPRFAFSALSFVSTRPPVTPIPTQDLTVADTASPLNVHPLTVLEPFSLPSPVRASTHIAAIGRGARP